MNNIRIFGKESDSAVGEQKSSFWTACPRCGEALLDTGVRQQVCRRCQFSICVECEGATRDESGVGF